MKQAGPLKMADVARLANVSMSTVSRALADSPLLPLEKRLEIQKIARDAGYSVNQAARSLRIGKTNTIAVVFPLSHDVGQLVSDPFFIEMFARLADEITKRDYQVLLYRLTKTSDGWIEKIIQSQRQDGLIIIGQSDQDRALNKASSMYNPMIVWGGELPSQTYCSVGTNNIAGGRRAVEHLLSLGRTKIAFLGMPDLPEIGLRQQGYFSALEGAGIAIDLSLSIPTHFSFDAAYAAAMNLVKSGVPFDAIFAASDVIALASIQALGSLGIAVPRDVSVIGFDDIASASQAATPLTTIKQDLAAGARAMTDLLFKKMTGDTVRSITLEPRLILRQSCGGQT